MPRLTRWILVLAMPIAATSVRAQEVGAPVYLYQPGPVTSTLLAAPSSPAYTWGTSIWYWGNSTPTSNSVTALSMDTHAVGTTVTSAASIPSQNGSPLVFTMGYVMKSDLPANGSQPGTDIPNYFVTTGFQTGNNVASGAQASAAVLFGPNNTAQIGFAPIGTLISRFADYPIRIGVTNVFNASTGRVPEPETWVLTLAGLLGAMLLRRRKRQAS